MDSSVGIIGLGFVGDALQNGFEHFGLTNIGCYDPYKLPGSDIYNVSSCDIIFICVPTPMKSGGYLDDSVVRSVLHELQGSCANGVIVIKSTLLPTSVNELIKQYQDLRIVTNPEFLTERKARQDFINTEWILIGGDKDDVSEVKKLYRHIYRNSKSIKYAEVTAEAAMMAKYMTNVWFSVKVSLMNEFYEIWNVLKQKNVVAGEWDDIVDAFSLDNRVGSTHLDVPGPDGDFGFGGKCFPKDLNAFMNLMKDNDTSCRILAAAWNDNSKYRNNKDWLAIAGAISGDYVEET